jgi:hypothetical protein
MSKVTKRTGKQAVSEANQPGVYGILTAITEEHAEIGWWSGEVAGLVDRVRHTPCRYTM